MARIRKHQALLAATVAAALAGGVAVGVLYTRRRRARPASARVGQSNGPVTQATVQVNPADSPMGQPGKNTEQRLDEGIQETFPASDPVSVQIE